MINLIKRVVKSNLIKDILYTKIIPDGLCHNSFYRGKDITDDFLSGKVSDNIANETFHDIFPGDIIILNDRTYVVGGLDCYLGKGDAGAQVSSHHLLMFPLEPLGTAQMNPTDITTGGFKGSKLYQDLNSKESGSYYSKVSVDFGSEHLLEFRALLSNDTITEQSRNRVRKIAKSSGWEWSTEFITLMSEMQVYGGIVTSSSEYYDIGEATEQLPVFKLNPNIIYRSFHWWLRGVASTFSFCTAYLTVDANYDDASDSLGVRPFFLIR